MVAQKTKTYDEYVEDAKKVRLRQKTAFMTQPNEAEPLDPRIWGDVSVDDIVAFEEALKCAAL
ncbi:MAG: hypothetical protein LBU70_06180 [Chitinispirillales bacterium]|jgi:hypothetical protein|nr:hypothetical protein [Chitinispirillales bacterium]